MKKILIILLAILQWTTSQAKTLDGDLAVVLMMRDMNLRNGAQSETVALVPTSGPSSDVYRVTLNHAGAGKIRLLLKGPRGFLNQTGSRYRALMIVSGFFTGEQSIHLVGGLADRVLVGFEYPYGLDDFQNDPGAVFQFVRQTPAQIALALKWLTKQNWMRPSGLSVMGVSLGGIFLPSGLHLSQNLGVVLENSIYVCTGTDIHRILSVNLKPYTLDVLLNPLVISLVAPTKLFDPKIHLSYLRQNSIVVQTDNDQVIPRPAQLELIESLPHPKREIILSGSHINGDQLDLIQKVQQTILELAP